MAADSRRDFTALYDDPAAWVRRVAARLPGSRAALAAHLRPTSEWTTDGLENSHV